MKRLLLPLILILLFESCGKHHSPEEKKYIQLIEKQRTEKNEEMKTANWSPFVVDPQAHFSELKYFDIDPDFVFKSKLTEYPLKDTVDIYGTKGELRKYLRYGYLEFKYKDKQYRMNVYNGTSRAGQEFYMLQFTDRTTNKETYGVGRYLDFELNKDKEFEYTIDFNLAYNPYCAYSAKFSCAVPRKEDYLDINITAGEKKFHN